MSDDVHDRFRSDIGRTLGVAPESVSLFARGRVALYAILRAMGVGEGDEIIVPAFTCVAVPNAILYTGARPVWVDIDPISYGIDPRHVMNALSPRTQAILAQNTFGLPSDLDALSSIAQSRGLLLIDDSTHGLGGKYHGRPNGTSAPFAFFSTQWSKPISTGLGGIAIAQDADGAKRIRELEHAALEPPMLATTILRTLVTAREHAGRRRPFRVGRGIYRSLSHRGLVPGSSSAPELEGTTIPDGFLMRMASWQARAGSDRIQELGALVRHRQAIAKRYSEWLAARDHVIPPDIPGVEHTFLRYPLRVLDRPAFIAAANNAGVDLGDWFVSPVHPVVGDLSAWGYVPGVAPVAQRICEEIVNLPVDTTMTDKDVDDVLGFLATQERLIV
jgi:dTDP-4-amino-4,6-dideoxygalactose transaminase